MIREFPLLLFCLWSALACAERGYINTAPDDCPTGDGATIYDTRGNEVSGIPERGIVTINSLRKKPGFYWVHGHDFDGNSISGYVHKGCVTLGSPAAQPPTVKTATASKPSVGHAEWNQESETLVGLTQQQFTEAGLSKLTTAEYGHLLSAMITQQVKVRQEGQNSRPLHVCGPIPERYDKVRVSVEANDTAPSEIVSGVRQRLRGMPDVEIVFAPLEADFNVSILSMETENKMRTRTGYLASVVTADTCQGSLGEYKWTYQSQRNHWVFTDSETASLAETIVTSLDTKDIEPTRQLHANLNKLKSPQPK